MLTWRDCLDLTELSEAEIEAIAMHEHLPQMAALELGAYLCRNEAGVPMIRRMILDDIEAARQAGDFARLLRLKMALRHFVETHPEAGRAGRDDGS